MEINCYAQPSKLKVTFQIAGAMLGSFALIVQLYLAILIAPTIGLTYLGGFIRFFSFMTIWTNILVTLHFVMGLIAPNTRLNKFLAKPIMQCGMLVYILIVSLVYHFLLADLRKPQGMQAVADISLHYLVPIYYLIYYLAFAPKGLQEYKNSFKWLIYPLVYIVFSMVYGAVTNLYPYPFIDAGKLTVFSLISNIAMLAAGYYLFGVIVVFLDRALAGKRRG